MTDHRSIDYQFFSSINLLCDAILNSISYPLCRIDRISDETREDLKTHLHIHSGMIQSLAEIEEGVSKLNRRKVVIASCVLSEGVRKYGSMVKDHTARFGENKFLTYPTSKCEGFLGVFFNHECTLDGLFRELEGFDQGIRDFDDVNLPLQKVAINGKLKEVRELYGEVRARYSI